MNLLYNNLKEYIKSRTKNLKTNILERFQNLYLVDQKIQRYNILF